MSKLLKHNVDWKLKTRAMDLTLENFETLHKTQVFLNLPTNTVIEILKSDDLIVSSEEDVFNAVKLWVNHDDANRKLELVQLMGSVRLSLLSIKFLVDEVMTFCHSCAEYLSSIRQVIKDKDDKSSIQRDTPRRKKEKIALVGGNYLDLANTIDIFDGLKKSWTLSKDIGIDKINFASVVVGDWMVIIGGSSPIKIETSVEYIDLKSGQKHPLKPLNQARYKFSAVTLRHDSSTYVYAIGGDDSLKSVERWNSKIGNWEIIAPLLVAVNGHCASVIDGKIFVTGGILNNILTNKLQIYSVETNSWSYRADMIQGRSFHSNVVIKGKLFIAGGYYWLSPTNVLSSVEQYDPIANVWTAFTQLPNPADGIILCCFQNKLLSMGGHIQWYGHSSKVWEYDETNMSWKVSSRLSKERTSAAAHVIPYDSIIWAPQQQLSADNLTPTIQQLGADNSTTKVSIARTILRKINFFKFFFRK
ncbi:kelch-like protein 35 [Arctopsyche grandis]|uniref:kelch-like protein 35 n=1 Tax=Arctopsyche grandis TaxID=121162 RepID=UPI00406D6E5E